MVLTQESVLSLLIAEGGKVKKSDLVGKFKGSIDCDDPAEKERNKELFKTFVNKIAVVKEIDGVRYVVVRKIYQHLLDGAQTAESRVEEPENMEIPLTGEQRSEETGGSADAGGERSAVSEPDREQAGESGESPMRVLTSIEMALQKSKYKAVEVKRMLSFEIQRSADAGGERPAVSEPDREQAGESGESPMRVLTPIELALQKSQYESVKVKKRMLSFEEIQSSADAGGERSAVSEPDREQAGESGESPTRVLTPIELALQKSQYESVKVKRMLSFEIQRQEARAGDNSARRGAFNEPTVAKSKPYALPLRVPPSATLIEIRKLKVDPDDPPGSPKLDSFGNKRRPPSVETSAAGSPQLRRSAKSNKEPEEPRETRVPYSVPLEQSEHEWLVKCAAGLWSQVYGLLLRDNQLAEKRDFMSGFTALHWAAKCGNSEMVVKIVDLSRQGGAGVDVNAKTHGGYTPLHIAALHDQEYIMAMLVREFGADPRVRDNCGKRAYHYLHRGISETVREMLGEPRAQEPQDRALHDKEELDLFPDLPKGLHSISRLFQPHMTGHKKKHKQRPMFYSMGVEPSKDREDSGFRHRLASDVFM